MILVAEKIADFLMTKKYSPRKISQKSKELLGSQNVALNFAEEDKKYEEKNYENQGFALLDIYSRFRKISWKSRF